MANDIKLQVRNLRISFRTQAGILKAVRNISFDLKTGETLAIVGESGSGKSVTSKAIIGILSGNSIVEGGEILYDGQDLLKIDEEHFHKIRGDKIAMIFQDPLSSLNPIMRVGRQLTEAMILNGKARQRNARSEFNTHIALLKAAVKEIATDPSDNALCDTFNAFCVISTKLEKAFNDAQNAAVTLKADLEETIFLIEKEQKVEYHRILPQYIKLLKDCYHPYVFSDQAMLEHYLSQLKAFNRKRKVDGASVLDVLKSLLPVLDEAIASSHPDFFRLGYYKMKHPDFDPSSFGDVKALDAMTLKVLDEEFMLHFLEIGAKAIQFTHDSTVRKQEALLERLKAFYEYLKGQEIFEKKEINARLKPLYKEVETAINELDIIRASSEYSFKISLEHELDRYYEGLKRNPVNQRKHERSKAKYDKLVASGKNPSWKVVPPFLVDLELTRENIEKIVADLIAHYEEHIKASPSFRSEKAILDLVDYLKEQASRFVTRVSQGVAKARALELLKEVGIPQPHIRYKQYPFEFSGGMRQRIVIAIALSANPDILICDEPTTALDVTIQSQILELINKIKEERHLSVIFITHDLGVVANMADRIAVMYAGKIVEYGTADDIFYDPRHPYTWALLASMPDLETKEKLEAIPGTPPNMIYPPVGDAFADRNKYALAIDFEQEPPMFEVTPTHYAATWLLHPNAPKVEPPAIIGERIRRMKEKEGKDHE